MRCEIFEKYAAFNGSTDEVRADKHPIHATQIDLMRWQEHNFSSCDDRDLALGVVEEVGELLSACDVEEFVDAKGDIAAYLGQLLMRNRISIETVFSRSIIHDSDISVNRDIVGIESGNLARAVLKHHQGIRGYSDPDTFRQRLFGAACDLVEACMISPRHYYAAAEVVLKRDWVANKETGG